MRSIRNISEFLKRHETLFLFCLVYFIYNINGRTIACLDTMPASLLPFSILENHNLYLDQFYNYIQTTLTYWVQEIDGHYLSSYPVVTPVLVTPLYVLPFLLMKLAHIPVDMFHPGFALIVSIMEKLSASMIASSSTIFVFLSARELINKKIAIIIALIFAFATNTWTTSSQGLWQHGLVELLLAMSIYLVLINEKRESNNIIISLGIISGLFLFNRPVDSILLMPTIYYIFSLRDRRIAFYLCALFISGLPFLFYNLHYFGNLFGGYATLVELFNFSPKMVVRLMGLLISPSRGLFIYTPIILFSILGYSKILQIQNRNIRNFLLITGISISVLIAVYASFEIWWAGWSYGPRFLTGMLPALAIFIGLYIKDISIDVGHRKSLFVIVIFSVLLIWSIYAQIVGAFYYPNGNWDADLNEKLWDWKDTQIMRSFSAGIISPRNYIRELQKVVRQQQDIITQGKLGKGWRGTQIWNGESTRWFEDFCRNVRFGSRYRLRSAYFDGTGSGPVLRLAWEGLDDEYPDYTGYVHFLDGKGTLLESFDFHRRPPLLPPEKWEAKWYDNITLPESAFRDTVGAIALCLKGSDGNLLKSEGCSADWGGKRLYVWTRPGRPLPPLSTGVSILTTEEIKGILTGQRLAENVSFGNRFLLVGAAVTTESNGLRLDFVWRNLKCQNLSYVVFVHILNGEGKMMSNADYPQSRECCIGPEGMVWHDVVYLTREKLESAETLGMGLYRPPDAFLPVKGGKTDWGSRRLLADLPAF